MSDSPTPIVRESYGRTAQSGLSSDDPGVHRVAQAFGYSAEELAAIPAEANMGLSCGNPLATANLRAGETVVDLGSGGGLDVFLAARKVGPSGRAIGIDMTPEMIELARRNAAKGYAGQAYENVQFLLGRIDQIPLPDASADVIISNCVINLAEDKEAVFAEMFRILKPGGRVAVSDIALKQALPSELAESIAAHVGCIAGAISPQDFQRGLSGAGFADIAIVDTGADLNSYALADGQAGCCTPSDMSSGASDESAGGLPVAGCCSSPPEGSPAKDGESSPPGLHRQLADLLRRYDVNAHAAAVRVFALKPTAGPKS
ncbi:arsenite methyltransferase [Roseimaritima sediminicola]|uniref:arsenite methyltransferase n=1 Tax=Roseimaritima sediminicola TaxID=2662066 RepID=UPI00129836EF|nr:arsenite methyltransferase [Roseimaritima sediminicola]